MATPSRKKPKTRTEVSRSKRVTARAGKPQRKKGWNYPRAGYGPIRRWIPSWRFVLGSFLTLIALGIGSFVGLYATTEIPEADDFATAESTSIYFADGETKLGQFSEVNRDSVPLDEISVDLRNAVVASEDRRFYENNGVDLKGLARAFWNNVRGNATQGGSTLTQQYAERYYMGTTTSIPGKVKEAMMALKIDATQSKETVLENYLNTIYFGRGAYGVEAAAQAYFGVSAKDLTLSQSAMLAGVIPAPSVWDPAVSPDRAEQRFERVLRLMVEDQWITQAEADAASMPETIDPNQDNSLAGPNGYIVSQVQTELTTLGGFSEDEINRSGYKVITTIDEEKQGYLEAAVDSLPQDRPENNLVGAVSMDPRNGEVYAMYGGADYLSRQRSLATQDRAQGGSTFKIFGLLAAVREGYSPQDRINAPASYDVPGGNTGVLTFNNVDGRSYGMQTLEYSTARSLNTPFIILNETVGPAKTRQAAIDLGIPEDTPGLDNGVGNVLGSASPTPMEMVRAFGTLANEGERASPHVVREVIDSEGNVIYTGPTQTERTVEKDDTIIANSMLEEVFGPNGTAADYSLEDRPVAGKTGTSTGPKSAWIGGYTPQIVTVVDMIQIGPDGSEEDLTPFDGLYQIAGGNLPASVWHHYMDRATDGMEVIEFTDPAEALRKRNQAPVIPVAPRPDPPVNRAPIAPSEPEETTPEPEETSSEPEETTAPEPVETTEAPPAEPTPAEPPAEPAPVEPTADPAPIEPPAEPTPEPAPNPGGGPDGQGPPGQQNPAASGQP